MKTDNCILSVFCVIINSKIIFKRQIIKMTNTKDEVDVNKMYGDYSKITRSEFLQTYKISENRTFK